MAGLDVGMKATIDNTGETKVVQFIVSLNDLYELPYQSLDTLIKFQDDLQYYHWSEISWEGMDE
jgi:hypothetical protein